MIRLFSALSLLAVAASVSGSNHTDAVGTTLSTTSTSSTPACEDCEGCGAVTVIGKSSKMCCGELTAFLKSPNGVLNTGTWRDRPAGTGGGGGEIGMGEGAMYEEQKMSALPPHLALSLRRSLAAAIPPPAIFGYSVPRMPPRTHLYPALTAS